MHLLEAEFNLHTPARTWIPPKSEEHGSRVIDQRRPQIQGMDDDDFAVL
jgi:hypothetical protein